MSKVTSRANKKSPCTVLLTGATGYVGGRLLRILEERNLKLRCLARRADYLRDRVQSTTEIMEGDVLKKESLQAALQGIDIAYYLIHSMGAGENFEALDRQAARNFAEAARDEGVRRIIYLGGLGDGSAELSPHLRSRHEVGAILAGFGGEYCELRASIVIGSGSLSFEMVRALTERLPVMITPRWVEIKAQPIAISDLLDYLVSAMEIPLSGSHIFEIGSKDRMSYGEIMQEYAKQRDLRRIMIAVPVLTPKLSSLWLGLVTPLYARVGRKLIDSIRHPTVVTDDSAREALMIEPKSVRQAIAEALDNEDRKFAETRWYDAISSAGLLETKAGVRLGNRLIDLRQADVDVPPGQAFAPIQRIGGKNGWYSSNWLWRLRGFIDLLLGGVGMRRGRRHPSEIRPGDAIDFWRVEAFEPEKRLLLQAEMRVPGRAWLEFSVKKRNSHSTIRQLAMFDPAGLWGLLYWYAVYPLHSIVFAGMIRNLAKATFKSGETT